MRNGLRESKIQFKMSYSKLKKKSTLGHNLLVTYFQSFLILYPELYDFKALEFLLIKYNSNCSSSSLSKLI